MNALASPIILSSAICAALIVLVVLHWRRIDATYGQGGIVIYLALVAFFPLQCLLWTLSLCPPLNDPDNPLILGTGGAVYGLNYDDYLSVTLLLATMPVPSLIFLLLRSRGARHSPAQGADTALPNLRVWLSWASLPLFLLSFAFLIEFLRQEGVARLWSSPLARFEGALWDTGTEAGSQSGSLFMRVYLLFLYLSSIIAAISLAFNTRKRLNLLTLLANLPPFLIWESRGLSVVMSVGILGWVFSLAPSKTRRFIFAMAAVVILAIYQVPLILRELPGTGVAKFGAAAELVGTSDEFGFQGCAVRTLQSISQCFPNFASYYEEYREGVNEMDQLPSKYKWLALSPTVSTIDGWAQNCMDLQLRINYYTPISAWSELFLADPLLPYLVLSLYSLVVLILLREMAKSSLGRLAFSPMVAALYAISLVMASQYYTRTFSRFMWPTLFASVLLLVVMNRIARARERAPAFRPSPLLLVPETK